MNCVAIELKRREYVYCQPPKDYGISGCPQCRHDDCQWSEFVHRCWCPICRIDFEPRYKGIFDGPIGVQLCELIGIRFDAFHIETQTVVPFECPTWPKPEFFKPVT